MSFLTERKSAEAVLVANDNALRESETRFRELADNISQFAWTADAKGWIYWYNKRWHDYAGTTLEDMQGWGWQKVHHPEHVDRVVQRIRQSFENGTPWEDTPTGGFCRVLCRSATRLARSSVGSVPTLT
jgi:PAS domain-containing protein